MKQSLLMLAIIFLLACSNDRQNNTASPGTFAPGTTDTSKLITDSVVIRDSNATDIDAMKKIN